VSGAGWAELERSLAVHTPATVTESVGSRAAVALLLRDTAGGLELLFIRRAEHEGDPWSGHVGFPGGRAEPGEGELLTTAIRETLEETAIDLARDGTLLGRLDEVRAMARGRPVDLAISPFVFRLRQPAEGAPNHEVVSLHWLPLSTLLDSSSRSTVDYVLEEAHLTLPCLRVGGLVIWGLTYRMFDNLRHVLSPSGV
jgi:8-oxo-dGTP pyrophosphatase MutT (NUDIX family)